MYSLRSSLNLSVFVFVFIAVLADPATSVANEHCDGNSCVQSSNNTIHIENNNSSINRNENVQVVEIDRPDEEVVTVTEGGTPVYEEITVITETPPTGTEHASFLAIMAAGLLGFAIRKPQARFISKFII